MEKLIVVGAGGYAKSVLDSIDYGRYDFIGFIDDYTDKSEHLGYPIIAHNLKGVQNPDGFVYFIAIGNNEKRRKWYDRLTAQQLRLINVIDRSAMVSPHAQIGTGCFIGKMAIVNSNAIIGNDCIVNTRALVEHGCLVEDHVNLSTNSVINGDVIVGEGSFIGSCSVTIGQRRIGRWSTIGAGAVVIHDVGDNMTFAGVPAKMIKTGAMLG